MIKPPLLTVAIPTYNGARHLREAVRSLQTQSELDFDILVSDDRSQDDTLAILQQELGDRVRIVENSERLGLAGNWNRCVALCQTPLIAIFHQDDVFLKSTWQRTLRRLKAIHPSACVRAQLA